MSKPNEEPASGKPQPYSDAELKAMVEAAKSQSVDPEITEWAKNSVDDPCKEPDLIERARRLGIPIPQD